MIAFLSLHTSGILGVKLCLDSFHWLGVYCGFCRCFPHSSGTSQCTLSPSRIFLKVKHIRQFASTMFLPLESPLFCSIWTGCLMDLMDAQQSPRITLSPLCWLESHVPRIP